MKNLLHFHELPWYFMRRLIGLNSTIREKCSVLRQKRQTEKGKVEQKGTKRKEEKKAQ